MSAETKALKTYRGNCHCGAYIFEATLPEITSINTCTCSICRRNGTVLAWTNHEDVAWIKGGAQSMKSYTFGNERFQHKFCETCGTPVAVVGALVIPNQSESNEKKRDIAVNLRCLQHGLIPDIWDMNTNELNGALWGGPYAAPEYTGPEPKMKAEDDHLYTGSCHCGAVKVAVNSKPLDKTFSEPVYECNCSGCIRAAGSCIYPHMDQVVIEGAENTTRYSYGGLRGWEKYFCKNCGTFIGRIPRPIPEEVAANLPEMARKWTVDMHHLRPINLRILNGVDLKEIKATHIDGYDNIPPPYVNP
ncbi:glutathione-dependent formaldehyde-activating enzyme [Xylariales sp. PMI_506]|nr:glutathione-dependent formaldehyde-activating enzyme [Xylariales sp. PMI_506]